MISFAATLLALKFAESTGAVEFEGWDGVLGAAVICWFGDSIPGWVFLAFGTPDLLASPDQTLWLALAIEFISTMLLLLLAWAVVPRAHIKNAFGLVLATVLIVVFRHVGSLVVGSTGLGWL